MEKKELGVRDSGWGYPLSSRRGPEFDSTPTEKIYFVLEGEVTIKTPKEEIVLRPWDSIHIGPNEGREIINRTNKPASMLVVTNYPD